MGIDNLGEWETAFDALKARITAAGETIVNQGTALLATNTKANVKRVFSARQTGGLAGSVQPIPAVSTGFVWSGRVEVGKVYARIQEKGGTIVPRVKAMLAWKTGTTWHFARSVTLPARPYFAPAIATSAEPFRSLAARILSEVIRGG